MIQNAKSSVSGFLRFLFDFACILLEVLYSKMEVGALLFLHWFTNIWSLIFFFSSVARIQFKLPNGVSQIHRFDPADTIGDLYNHVINELTTPYGSNVSLSTTFPSRNLDDVERLVYEYKMKNPIKNLIYIFLNFGKNKIQGHRILIVTFQTNTFSGWNDILVKTKKAIIFRIQR